jgi:ATP:ADP antiporter, AAA family
MVSAAERRFEQGVARFAVLRPGEGRAVAWSFAYFFALLAGYYVLRPLRDQAAITGGVKNLSWLFTATFLTMLVAQPIYGALVARLSRARFIPIVYHFFVANLALFWVLLTLGLAPVVMAWIFFVWISVFNLFAVSVFWSFMADLYRSEQSKRLFGLIGAGGTAGSVLGPVIVLGLADALGPVNLLIIAGLLLELAVLAVYRLEKAAVTTLAAGSAAASQEAAQVSAERVGGSWFAGITQLFASPYLAGIALWVSLLSFAGTILYFEQANLVAAAKQTAAAQTQFFAKIDLYVAIATIVVQAFVSGPVVKLFGTAAALALQPAIFVLGFAVLAVFPNLTVVLVFQTIQRTANFAFSNLGRQILFTPVSREDKYKTKNVIDVVVFRGSDALYGWVFGLFRDAGLALAAISGIAIPVVLGWAGLAWALGHSEARRAAASGQDDAAFGEKDVVPEESP